MATRFDNPFAPLGCEECRKADALDFDFTMAYQPIVDIQTDSVFAYEALVRGLNGEGAREILGRVNDHNRYRFDQVCRVKAIQRAVELGIRDIPECRLSINFLPNAIYRPETCIRSTLEACGQFRFPSDLLMFEVTEGEHVEDASHLIDIFTYYRKRGFLTAIDDFGSGYAGLNFLSTFQPHVLKIDMEITRSIDTNVNKQAIVEAIALVCTRLGIQLIAEGIETEAEKSTLSDLGIRYQQGFLFAPPQLEALALR